MSRSRFLVIVASVFTVTLLAFPAWYETGRVGDAWTRDYYVLNPFQVVRMINQGKKVVLLDIREPEEHAAWRIPMSRCVPLRDIASLDLGPLKKADVVITYCWKDLRGFEAAKKLKNLGLENVSLFEGYGAMAWENAILPSAGTDSGLSDAEAMKELAQFP